MLDAPLLPAKAPQRVDLSLAGPHAQALLDQRVSFDYRNAGLEQVILGLRQSTGMNLLANPNLLKKPPTLTLKVDDLPLREALWRICEANRTTVQYAPEALIFDVEPVNGVAPRVAH